MNGASISLIEQFSQMKDPRVDRTNRHKLTDVIAIAVCAVICGDNTAGRMWNCLANPSTTG